MSKKSVLLVAIAMLFSILLAGCGGGGGDKKAAAPAAPAAGGNKLIIYTSMKESLIGGIVEGFKKKNPGIEVDYQSAGAGKLMAKIAAERQSGKILADIIWTSEVPDFYSMKKEGILEQYKTPLFKEILNPFDDYDGYFTAARLGTLGIAMRQPAFAVAAASRLGDGVQPGQRAKHHRKIHIHPGLDQGGGHHAHRFASGQAQADVGDLLAAVFGAHQRR